MPAPEADTENVVVSLSPTSAGVGCKLMETELRANVAVDDVAVRETPFNVLVMTT